MCGINSIIDIWARGVYSGCLMMMLFFHSDAVLYPHSPGRLHTNGSLGNHPQALPTPRCPLNNKFYSFFCLLLMLDSQNCIHGTTTTHSRTFKSYTSSHPPFIMYIFYDKFYISVSLQDCTLMDFKVKCDMSRRTTPQRQPV